jgi:hypothetical protein
LHLERRIVCRRQRKLAGIDCHDHDIRALLGIRGAIHPGRTDGQ